MVANFIISVIKMLNSIESLSTVLAIIALILLISVCLIHFYFWIRRKFSISVNCWFCNSWARVPYDNKNSFTCPNCEQYNGFTKDGDYNKIIPEQHDEFMNKSRGINSKKSPSNGLCTLCNHNQQLKVFQLAHFVPLVEDNYDVEIEHFQEQLEKAYKLCKKCDKVLKTTISKQNVWIGNRLKNLSRGISKLTNQLNQESRVTIIKKIEGCLIIFLVIGVVFTTLLNNKFFTNNLANYIPTAYLSIYKNVISTLNTPKTFKHFSNFFKVEPHFAISGVGLLFQTFRMFLSNTETSVKLNQLLCWVIFIFTSWLRFSKNYTLYILFIEVFSCVYLLSTAFSKSVQKRAVFKPIGMRKLVKNLEYTTSDVENFENSSGSSKTSSLEVPRSTTASPVLTHFQSDLDMNRSLTNLHLRSTALSRPKPVLSPPRFQLNSSVSEDFWRDRGLFTPPIQRSTLSRSSSESSGFGSQFDGPRYSEFDKVSINSERLSPFFAGRGFYPVRFDPYQSRGFQSWSDRINAQTVQSFKDLRLRPNF